MQIVVNLRLADGLQPQRTEQTTRADTQHAVGAEQARNSNKIKATNTNIAKRTPTNRPQDDFYIHAYNPPHSTRMDAGRSTPFPAFCTAATPLPRSHPSRRAVT